MLSKVYDVELNTLHGGQKRTDIHVNQGDTRSVVFNFRVFEGAEEIKYADVATAVLFCVKPDKNIYETELIRLPRGFTVTLTSQALAVPGTVVSGLALYGHAGERITTLEFLFWVASDRINADVIESSTEFNSLIKALTLLRQAQKLYDDFPQLKVLGEFDTAEELLEAFPDGANVGGGFWVGGGRGDGRYYYWSITAGKWVGIDPWRGPQGKPGEKGATGDGFIILDVFGSLAELEAMHPVGNIGDAYLVDDEIFIWSERAGQWVSGGNIGANPLKFTDDNPEPVGNPSPGESDYAARADHVHGGASSMPPAPSNHLHAGRGNRWYRLEGTEERAVITVTTPIPYTVTPENIHIKEWDDFEIITIAHNGAQVNYYKQHSPDRLYSIGDDTKLYKFEFDPTAHTVAITEVALSVSSGGANQNILHNWDFRNPVNERRLNAYYATDTRVFAIDRWYLWQGSYDVPSRTLSTSNQEGSLMQRIENSDLYQNLVATFSISVNGIIYSNVGTLRPLASGGGGTTSRTSITVVFVGGYCIMQSVTSNSGYRIRIMCDAGTSITIDAIKLEIGNTSTLANDPPMDFGRELNICKRYQLRLGGIAINPYHLNANNVWFYVPTSPSLRISPTLTGIPVVRNINNINQTDFTFRMAGHDTHGFIIEAIKPAHGLCLGSYLSSPANDNIIADANI